MQRQRHSSEFKEQALIKARQRGAHTLDAVAKELNLPLGTLKVWIGQANKASGSAHAQSLTHDTAAGD